MTFEKTLEELKTLKDSRPEICQKIKSHNLPVVVLGAGNTAGLVADDLKSCGVEIFGYAVDEKYYKPNQSYKNHPVYNFAEISTEPDKYVFVLGTSVESAGFSRAWEFLNDKRIIRYAFIGNDPSREMNYEYIFANREKFAETFSLFEDELSRQTLVNVLKAKLTLNMKYYLEVYRRNEYFNELTNGIRKPNRGGVH